MALASTCDVCGKLGDGRESRDAIHARDRMHIPAGWSRISLWVKPQDSESADVCSSECAQKYAAEQFSKQPPPEPPSPQRYATRPPRA